MSNQGQQGWLRRWRAFGMTFAVAKGCNIRPKWTREATAHQKQEHTLRKYAQRHKEPMYKERGGRCEMCGCERKQSKLHLHHILPLERYPELAARRENLMLLCPDCHTEVHQNPFLNSRLMVKAACKMKVDLAEKYEK